ncbi:acyl carrier protein [Nonomuraea bangladeshensis]|jgi:acyl carrier protein|uniref:Acyl carrier protein n=1 Tax=Nonomuraea bangladeshensis TaxID=404385 RepID=A0ABV3HJM6_9ACTN
METVARRVRRAGPSAEGGKGQVDAMNVEIVTQLMAAVGADVTPEEFDQTFESLNVDSLALAEISARAEERYGVVIEGKLTAETTPAQLGAFLGEHASVTKG